MRTSRQGECLVDNCSKPRKGRGYCAAHWSKWRKYGDPTVVLQEQAEHFLMLPNGKFAHNSPEYSVWCAMKARCKNPNNPEYKNYGGRGIQVCDRWKEVSGFANFIEDMGLRTTPKHSLDRIDVDGNYEPSNCRWATGSLQNHNRRLHNKNKSGYTGVFQAGPGRWLAYITFNRKRKHIGVFADKVSAASARDEYAIKHYGKNAKLNLGEQT